MTPVVAGTICLGHIFNRGKQGWEAFDSTDRSLGLFTDAAAAVAKITEEHNDHIRSI